MLDHKSTHEVDVSGVALEDDPIFEAHIVAVAHDPVTNHGDVVLVRGEDGIVMMRIGQQDENFDVATALKLGEALIMAAYSQVKNGQN